MKKLNKFGLSLMLGAALILAACADEGEDKNGKKPKKVTEVESADSVYDVKVIYGDDNRQDLYEVTDSTLRKLADSTVALMSKRDLVLSGNSYVLDQTTFGQAYGLCASEPYREQVNHAFCSGFLVGKNLVATAGHCVRSSSDCSDVRFVFGYAMPAAGVNPRSVPVEEVYSCKRIVHTVVESRGKDYAVIELDREVVGHEPLRVRRSGTVGVGDKLVVIGHPAGLPTKVAGGAQVRRVEKAYFVANLDTYGGNSGSAVFNLATGDVEGILVRGENDFITQGGCRVSNRCSDTGCRGEDVTKITEALTHIPEISGAAPVSRKVYTSTMKMAIPDNNSLGISSSIVTDEAPRGRKVYVEVNISHTWRGDLYVSLVSPDGVEHLLMNRQGRSARDLVGVFGKDFVADLSKAEAVDKAGVWTLRVSDRALRDIGQLNSWSLVFE